MSPEMETMNEMTATKPRVLLVLADRLVGGPGGVSAVATKA
jgi:hypothetical protein